MAFGARWNIRRKLLQDLIAVYGATGFSELIFQVAKSNLLDAERKGPNTNVYHNIGQLCRGYSVPYFRVETRKFSGSVGGIWREEVLTVTSEGAVLTSITRRCRATKKLCPSFLAALSR
jgi:hypothetical protein